MNAQSKTQIRKSNVRNATHGIIETLEARAYLTGIVLGAPASMPVSSGVNPVFANVADFNGDGKADLFVANNSGANSATNSVSVLISTSTSDTASFAAPITIPVVGAPLPLTTGKLVTGNSNLDIIAGTAGDVSVILGHGDGTFSPATNVSALPENQAIAVGQFTASGNQDVIAVSGSPSATNNAVLLLGDGQGGLTKQAPFSLAFGNVATVAVGDFNSDGKLDFVVADQLNNSITVYFGNGDGTFQAPHSYATGPSPTSMVVGDFTGNNRLDIVTADSTGGEVSYLANNGDGTFAAPVNSPVAGSGPGGGPLKVRLANFTGSPTAKDLVVLLGHGANNAVATVLLGNGNGTFHTGTTISAPSSTASNAIAAGDINADGLTDVVLTTLPPTTPGPQIFTFLNLTNADNSIPSATVDASQASGSSLLNTYDFTVLYQDSQQIDAGTLGNGNLTVTAPAGVTFAGNLTTEAATLVSTNLGNSSNVDATYRISFPANLSSADNGLYTVSMNSTNSVTNANGKAVPTGTFGSFTLNVVNQDITPPRAAVDATQAPGSTAQSVYRFTVTYTDNVDVDASSIPSAVVTVTFPGDTQTQTATLVSTNLTNGMSVQATYQISFGSTNLTSAQNGGYQVSISGSSVKDTSGNFVPAGSIGTFTLTVQSPDTTPPTASLNTPPAPTIGATTYDFTVTYADNVAVNAMTLGAGNLTVTYPDGTSHQAILVSSGLSSGQTVVATYEIAFSAGLTYANNGTYQVVAAANSVKDTSGNSVVAANIGSFAFNLAGFVPPTGDFAVSSVSGKFPASVVGGSKGKSGASVLLTYNPTAPLVLKANVTITLYISRTQFNDTSAVPIAKVITKKFGKLKPGKSFKVHFGSFVFPTTPGNYYLVVDAKLNGTPDSYDGSTPTPIAVAAPFVDADAIAVKPGKTTLVAGKKSSATFTLDNIGNVLYKGPATVDVSVVPTGGGAAVPVATGVAVNVSLKPSVPKKIHVSFTPGTLPTSGTYFLQLTIHISTDIGLSNNTVASTIAVTV